MGLNITKFSNVNNYSNHQSKNTNGISGTGGMPVYMQGYNNSKKIDDSNDGQFSISQAGKNFAKGLISPITTMFSSAKNFLVGTGMIAGSMFLVAATGGAAAPVFVAAGLGIGAFQASKAAVKIATAQNGDDVEKAFYDIGAATSTIGLSVAGAKSSLKQANIETEGMNAISASKKCVSMFKELSFESFNVFKSGYYKNNLSNTIKSIVHPKNLRKYSKELSKEGEQQFATSFEALKKALPEEFRDSLVGRSKSEISIYEKFVKERTTILRDKINKIKNDTKFTEEIKQQKIQELHQEIKRLNTNPDYAKKLIEDLYGARLILDDVKPESIDKLISSLIESAKKGKLKITEIENYRGMNKGYKGENDFYFSPEQIEALESVSPDIKVVNACKPSGYTAVQMKVKPKNGSVIELQIRGKEIDAFADIEHIPYDLRQGKDIAKSNNQSGILLSKVQKTLKSLSEEQYKKYQKYLYDNYVYAQARELGKRATKPSLPKGIDPILSKENLQALFIKTKSLNPGTVKNPFDGISQAIFVSEAKSLANNYE